MNSQKTGIAFAVCAALAASVAFVGCGTATAERSVPADTAALLEEGRRTFRFETFGDEQLWTDTLRLHEIVEKSLDPTTALGVGLKVEADVLPPGILDTST